MRRTVSLHNNACRIARHTKQIKSAELPYEDEKFIYVALTRATGRAASRPRAGATRHHKIAVTRKTLHASRRSEQHRAPPRQDRYARFRKYNWGDTVFDISNISRNNFRAPAFGDAWMPTHV